MIVRGAVEIHAPVRARHSGEEMSTLYAVLGLAGAAHHAISADEIKNAYRIMAKRFHPDRAHYNMISSCEECTPDQDHDHDHHHHWSVSKFLRVQEAYEVLSDPERRAAYDYSLLHPFCAQALGMAGPYGGVRPSEYAAGAAASRCEVSAAWRLQWEAQVSKLGARRRHRESHWDCTHGGKDVSESWGAMMRRLNSSFSNKSSATSESR